MEFPYNVDKDQLIKDHEKNMLEKFSEIIKSYSTIFEQYNCSLKVGLYRDNFLKKSCSYRCLPFENGYSCYIYCEVQKDGKEVHIKCDDGEADYYSLSTVWRISYIYRRFTKLIVSLCMSTTGVTDVLNDYLIQLKFMK